MINACCSTCDPCDRETGSGEIHISAIRETLCEILSIERGTDYHPFFRRIPDCSHVDGSPIYQICWTRESKWKDPEEIEVPRRKSKIDYSDKRWIPGIGIVTASNIEKLKEFDGRTRKAVIPSSKREGIIYNQLGIPEHIYDLNTGISLPHDIQQKTKRVVNRKPRMEDVMSKDKIEAIRYLDGYYTKGSEKKNKYSESFYKKDFTSSVKYMSYECGDEKAIISSEIFNIPSPSPLIIPPKTVRDVKTMNKKEEIQSFDHDDVKLIKDIIEIFSDNLIPDGTGWIPSVPLDVKDEDGPEDQDDHIIEDSLERPNYRIPILFVHKFLTRQHMGLFTQDNLIIIQSDEDHRNGAEDYVDLSEYLVPPLVINNNGILINDPLCPQAPSGGFYLYDSEEFSSSQVSPVRDPGDWSKILIVKNSIGLSHEHQRRRGRTKTKCVKEESQYWYRKSNCRYYSGRSLTPSMLTDNSLISFIHDRSGSISKIYYEYQWAEYCRNKETQDAIYWADYVPEDLQDQLYWIAGYEPNEFSSHECEEKISCRRARWSKISEFRFSTREKVNPLLWKYRLRFNESFLAKKNREYEKYGNMRCAIKAYQKHLISYLGAKKKIRYLYSSTITSWACRLRMRSKQISPATEDSKCMEIGDGEGMIISLIGPRYPTNPSGSPGNWHLMDPDDKILLEEDSPVIQDNDVLILPTRWMKIDERIFNIPRLIMEKIKMGGVGDKSIITTRDSFIRDGIKKITALGYDLDSVYQKIRSYQSLILSGKSPVNHIEESPSKDEKDTSKDIKESYSQLEDSKGVSSQLSEICSEIDITDSYRMRINRVQSESTTNCGVDNILKRMKEGGYSVFFHGAYPFSSDTRRIISKCNFLHLRRDLLNNPLLRSSHKELITVIEFIDDVSQHFYNYSEMLDHLLGLGINCVATIFELFTLHSRGEGKALYSRIPEIIAKFSKDFWGRNERLSEKSFIDMGLGNPKDFIWNGSFLGNYDKYIMKKSESKNEAMIEVGNLKKVVGIIPIRDFTFPVIDEIASELGMDKIGTHTLRIGGKLYLIYKIDNITHTSNLHVLSRRGSVLINSGKFARKVQEVLALRSIFQFSVRECDVNVAGVHGFSDSRVVSWFSNLKGVYKSRTFSDPWNATNAYGKWLFNSKESVSLLRPTIRRLLKVNIKSHCLLSEISNVRSKWLRLLDSVYERVSNGEEKIVIHTDISDYLTPIEGDARGYDYTGDSGSLHAERYLPRGIPNRPRGEDNGESCIEEALSTYDNMHSSSENNILLFTPSTDKRTTVLPGESVIIPISEKAIIEEYHLEVPEVREQVIIEL